MYAAGPSYCSEDDVLRRAYSEQATVPPNSTRDDLIGDLVAILSRSFDDHTGRPPGGFAPVYDVRTFEGEGRQRLSVDEFAVVVKVEINQSPMAPTGPTWHDYSAELATGQIVQLPPRYWPKTDLFRMQSFYTDPYRTGNVRLSGVWGCVQPDLSATPPVAGSQGYEGLTAIAALQPVNPRTGTAAGWWATPQMVREAIAEWGVRALKANQSGFTESLGGASGMPIPVPTDIPAGVRRVIDHFAATRPKVAMIGLDGTDFREEAAYGQASDEPVSRWAGWQTTP